MTAKAPEKPAALAAVRSLASGANCCALSRAPVHFADFHLGLTIPFLRLLALR